MSTAKTILVTGASRGIGRAICRRLLEQQYQVVGIARDFAKFGGEHPHFQPHVIDLAALDSLPQKLRELARQYPVIDGVICNAGRGQFGSLEEFSYAQIAALMDLNFTSQAYVARTFLPLMKRRKHGDLIFIGSEAALWGGRRGAVYSASKAALRGFAQALREECARRGVRVCVINPGMVRTEFFEQLAFAPGNDAVNAILPEEVAETVVQVLSYRESVVFDEINLSPLKKVLRFKAGKDDLKES
jgi:NADP-dependent 3-hydroxy acid dehydrogenase YdfG